MIGACAVLVTGVFALRVSTIGNAAFANAAAEADHG
jgi:hypothetical protein